MKAILMKHIEDTINGKISCTNGLEELILLKCPHYLKQFGFNVTPLKIAMTFWKKKKGKYKSNFIVCMEPQKILNGLRSVEPKRQNRNDHIGLKYTTKPLTP